MNKKWSMEEVVLNYLLKDYYTMPEMLRICKEYGCDCDVTEFDRDTNGGTSTYTNRAGSVQTRMRNVLSMLNHDKEIYKLVKRKSNISVVAHNKPTSKKYDEFKFELKGDIKIVNGKVKWR